MFPISLFDSYTAFCFPFKIVFISKPRKYYIIIRLNTCIWNFSPGNLLIRSCSFSGISSFHLLFHLLALIFQSRALSFIQNLYKKMVFQLCLCQNCLKEHCGLLHLLHLVRNSSDITKTSRLAKISNSIHSSIKV